jgi:hypothetical protein
LGGAVKVTDGRIAISDAVEVKVLAQHEPDRHLAERRGSANGSDEPSAVLDAIHGAVAESLGRCDDFLDWQAK